MYKKSVSVFVVLLLVLSTLTLAEVNETASEPASDSCSGFLNFLKCLFFGDASSRPVAGSAWYDRGIALPWYEPGGRALAGKTAENPTPRELYNVIISEDTIEENKNNALEQLENLCTGKNTNGCTYLGYMYANGQRVEEDDARAVGLYQRACNGEDAEGCNNLGYMYDLGQGVEQNYATAVGLYQQACDGGNVYGCGNLGVMEERGAGVAQDLDSARGHWGIACNGGRMKACGQLGELYLVGGGSTVASSTTALRYLIQACDGGEQFACTYLSGDGNGRVIRSQDEWEYTPIPEGDDSEPPAEAPPITTETQTEAVALGLILESDYNEYQARKAIAFENIRREAARTQAQSQLGEDLYGHYEEMIDWTASETGTCTNTNCQYQLSESRGEITSNTNEQGINTIEINLIPTSVEGEITAAEPVPTERYYRSGDIDVLSQTTPGQIAAGTYTVDGFEGQEVMIQVDDVVAALASDNGATFVNPENPADVLGWGTVSDGTIRTVNEDDDTQHIVTPAGDEYNLEGSADEDGRTFEPSGGTWTRVNDVGETERYILDYDTASTGNRLGDLDSPRAGDDIEIYDYRGRFVGVGHYLDENGVPQVITRVINENNMELTIRNVDGTLTTSRIIIVDGNVLCPSSVCPEFYNINSDEIKALLEQDYEEIQPDFFQSTFPSVYAVLQSTKSYPAINNLLWGDSDWYKNWQKDMDQTFAPLLAENWFPSWICEEMGYRDIEPEGVVTLTTPNGIDQMVASIEAERSPDATPMLCQYNQDEDLWFCEENQVCWEDGFCYKDENQDQEPDEEVPMEGYFYKITWGAGAPQDEALTPFIDENGVAVSFNVFIYGQNGKIPIYNRGGDTKGPIKLSNGASDQDVILKYSTQIYTKACLEWDQAPLTNSGNFPLAAIFIGSMEEVEDPCFNIVESTQGQVSWENSGQPESQGVSTGGDVPLSRNTNW